MLRFHDYCLRFKEPHEKDVAAPRDPRLYGQRGAKPTESMSPFPGEVSFAGTPVQEHSPAAIPAQEAPIQTPAEMQIPILGQPENQITNGDGQHPSHPPVQQPTPSDVPILAPVTQEADPLSTKSLASDRFDGEPESFSAKRSRQEPIDPTEQASE